MGRHTCQYDFLITSLIGILCDERQRKGTEADKRGLWDQVVESRLAQTGTGTGFSIQMSRQTNTAHTTAPRNFVQYVSMNKSFDRMSERGIGMILPLAVKVSNISQKSL